MYVCNYSVLRYLKCHGNIPHRWYKACCTRHVANMQAPACFGHHAGHVAAPQHTCHILTTLLPEIHQGLALQLVNASNQFLLGIENGCNPQTMHCAQIYSDMILLMIHQHGEIEKWSAVRGPSEINPSQQNGDVINAWNFFRIFLTVTACNLDQFGSHNISQEYVFFIFIMFTVCSPFFYGNFWVSRGPPIDPCQSWSRFQKRKPPAPAAPAAPQALRCSSARDKDGNSCRTWRRPNDMGCGLHNHV